MTTEVSYIRDLYSETGSWPMAMAKSHRVRAHSQSTRICGYKTSASVQQGSGLWCTQGVFGIDVYNSDDICLFLYKIFVLYDSIPSGCNHQSGSSKGRQGFLVQYCTLPIFHFVLVE